MAVAVEGCPTLCGEKPHASCERKEDDDGPGLDYMAGDVGRPIDVVDDGCELAHYCPTLRYPSRGQRWRARAHRTQFLAHRAYRRARLADGAGRL